MGRKVSADSSEESESDYKDEPEDSESDYKDEPEDSESDFTEEPEDSEEEYDNKKKRKQNKAKRGKKNPNTNKKDQTSSPVNKIIRKAQSDNGQQSILNKAVSSSSNDKNNPKTPSMRGNISDDPQSSSLLAVKDGSETEDEEALLAYIDYIADTDKDDDSGGNTEDEIRRVEMEILKNGQGPSKKVKDSKAHGEYSEKPDVTELPLPELLNLFKQKHFFLFGDFSSSKLHDMNRYIVAYNGVIEEYMSNSVKYVITDAKWDKKFDDALNENEDLIFVKPTWIYKCHDAGKLVPYQPYIVIPDT